MLLLRYAITSVSGFYTKENYIHNNCICSYNDKKLTVLRQPMQKPHVNIP